MVRPSVHKFDNVSVATLYAEVEKIRLLFPKFIEIETGQEGGNGWTEKDRIASGIWKSKIVSISKRLITFHFPNVFTPSEYYVVFMEANRF